MRPDILNAVLSVHIPRCNRRFHRAALLSAAGLAASAGAAHASVTTWLNPLDGAWSVAANWSPADVPDTPTEIADISVAGAYTVTLTGGYVFGGLTLTNPDAVLAINNGVSPSIVSNTEISVSLVNDGSIVVNAQPGINTTVFTVGDPDTAGLVGPGSSGAGEIVLNLAPGNGDLSDATLVIQGGGLHADGHTIRGKGRVNGLFANEGEIVADRIGDELRISGHVTQDAGGLLRATGGGLLGIGDDGIVSGGLLLTDTDGRIMFQSGAGTLAGGAHLMGDAGITNGQTMRVDAGGIINDGTISINSNQGLNYTQAVVVADTSILGTGRIDLNLADGNNDYSDATLTTSGATATNGPDHSITGKGRLAGLWVNDGQVRADRDGQELRVSAVVAQSATGSIRAIDNGVLGIAEGGRISGGSIVTSNGGTVQATYGTGTIDGGIVNYGDMGVYDNRTLQLDAGGMVNNGVISVNSNQGLNWTFFRVVSDTIVSGSGHVDLNLADGNNDYNDAQFSTAAGVTATIGINQSVTGKGRVTGTFLNRGTIDADRPGQDIRVSGTITQNAVGTIMGSNGGYAGLENAAITGGLFDSATGGAVLAAGGTNTISGVTNVGLCGLRDNTSLSILAGGFINDGVCSINSQPGINWTILTVAEDATISGTGRIDFNMADGNTDFNDAQLKTADGVTATNGAAHTVSGKGRISGTWINNGTITADRLDQDLQLAGSFDQSGGGVIRGENGGTAALTGAAVIGGTFEGDTGAVLAQGSSNSISGVMNLGAAGIRDNSSVNILSGGFANLGVFKVNSQPGINWTILTVTEDATINGSGRIELNMADNNGDFNDAQLNVAADVTATQGPAHTIAGKGRVTGTWTNHGTFDADRPGQDLQIASATVTQGATGVIRGDDGGAVAIHSSTITGGTFDSANGGSVQFAGGTSAFGGVHNTGEAGIRSGAYAHLLGGGLFNDGLFKVNSNGGIDWTILTATENTTIDGTGTMHLGLAPNNGDYNDAQLGAADGFTLTIGPDQTVTGKGRLFGHVEIEGTLSPGSSIATITANPSAGPGSLTLAPTAEYHVEASAEEVNDRISASVPVHLAGTLRFTPIDGFEPPRPTRYTIATGPEITGEFDTLIYEGTVPEGGVFKVVYTNTETIAAVTCAADIAPPIGILDLSDIVVFTQLFLSGSSLVDLAEPYGILDLADVLAYINGFLAGCG